MKLSRRNFVQSLALVGSGLAVNAIASKPSNAATTKRRLTSTKTLQGMLTKAGQTDGGLLELPPGDYLVDAPLWVPPGVRIIGANCYAPYSTRGFPISISEPMTAEREQRHFHVGTTFLVTTTAGPALLLGGDGCEVHGITFYYPEQNPTAPKWYPPTIMAHNKQEFVLGLAIKNNLFVNSWDAIALGIPGQSKIGQVLIAGNQGQILNIGVALGQVLDMVTVRDTHFWPFWAGNYRPVGPQVGLRCYESDWLQVHDFFTYGLSTGIQLLQSPEGRSCSGIFDRINIDACDIGVDVYSIAEWGVSFRDVNVVCAEVNPWGGENPHRFGIWGHQSNDTWAKNSCFKLDTFRVEGAKKKIQWDHPAPLQTSLIT